MKELIYEKLNFYGFKRFRKNFSKRKWRMGHKKEPVAKKVMPLLDMDGMEKDYRETGGFVDYG